ncbi:MAG: sensor histidine kinase [Candidatus Limivivens sp.]|nr:sensor histidine kinase [Candidatus Limivivens sp.]
MKAKGWIRKYLGDYKFNSLFFRNLVQLLVLIMIPLTGAIVLSYFAYGNMQKKEIQSYSEKIVADVYADLERILKECQTELMYFGFNSNVELYMYDEAVNQYNYKVKTIQDMVKMPVIAKDYVSSVYLYGAKSSHVISLLGVAPFETFTDRQMIEQYLDQEEQKKKLLVTESLASGYLKNYLTMFQEIRYGRELNGISMMNLDLEMLLKELDIMPGAEAYLTDGEIILLASDLELIGKPVEEMMEYDQILHGATVMDESFSTSSLVAPESGLEVITRVSLEGYHDQLSSLRNGMIAVLAVMTVITLGQSFYISVKLYQPIGRIVRSIQEVSNVLMGEERLFAQKNELDYILNSIQKTAIAKKNVDEELGERVRLLKKAQAVALQSQINPHFLNNTLETINWTAIELLGGRNEISEMAGALSRMLRMTLENSDTIVLVSTEVQHCMYYLEIQQKRYEDKFEVIWQIPEEVKQCKIIRIVLQPLVENAIYHGIKPLSGKGVLVISGNINGELAELTVSDNGLGMTPEELENVRQNMHSDMIKESSHIGVTNVNQRLKLYFGEKYGLVIDSREGMGTTVTARFPKILE